MTTVDALWIHSQREYFNEVKEMAMTYLSKRKSELRRCIEECNQCHDICLAMAMNHHLPTRAKHAGQAHLRLLINCSEICKTTANFMISHSAVYGSVCALCAEICDACARSCEEIGAMYECVEVCHRCAANCEDMVKTSGYRITNASINDMPSLAYSAASNTGLAVFLKRTEAQAS